MAECRGCESLQVCDIVQNLDNVELSFSLSDCYAFSLFPNPFLPTTTHFPPLRTKSPIALLAALPGETVRSYFQTMPFPVRSATHHVIGLTEEVPPLNVTNPSELRSLVVQSLLSAALANESEFGQDAPPMVPIRMGHEQRGRRGSERRGSANLTNSVMSTVSFTGGNDVDEDDMWTFSEAARREIFSRTVAQTSKNAVMQKEKKRKFVGMTTESRQAATNGFIPPEENN